jgi:hypothetical protein
MRRAEARVPRIPGRGRDACHLQRHENLDSVLAAAGIQKVGTYGGKVDPPRSTASTDTRSGTSEAGRSQLGCLTASWRPTGFEGGRKIIMEFLGCIRASSFAICFRVLRMPGLLPARWSLPRWPSSDAYAAFHSGVRRLDKADRSGRPRSGPRLAARGAEYVIEGTVPITRPPERPVHRAQCRPCRRQAGARHERQIGAKHSWHPQGCQTREKQRSRLHAASIPLAGLASGPRAASAPGTASIP